jgi:hypothetical protein
VPLLSSICMCSYSSFVTIDLDAVASIHRAAHQQCKAPWTPAAQHVMSEVMFEELDVDITGSA